MDKKYLITDELVKPFEITTVCRVDLQGKFTDEEVAMFDDRDMKYLASKMADAYCDLGFWEDLEIIGRHILDGKKKRGDR